MKLEIGNPAPAFSVLNQNSETITLDQIKGKKVVLYFYPKDDTPGCTQEACDFKDNHAKIAKKGALVLGVSADSPKSHGSCYLHPRVLIFKGIGKDSHRYTFKLGLSIGKGTQGMLCNRWIFSQFKKLRM